MLLENYDRHCIDNVIRALTTSFTFITKMQRKPKLIQQSYIHCYINNITWYSVVYWNYNITTSFLGSSHKLTNTDLNSYGFRLDMIQTISLQQILHFSSITNFTWLTTSAKNAGKWSRNGMIHIIISGQTIGVTLDTRNHHRSRSRLRPRGEIMTDEGWIAVCPLYTGPVSWCK